MSGNGSTGSLWLGNSQLSAAKNIHKLLVNKIVNK